ncbi:MAG TPA: C25 family cysteine peptidase, partial [Sedimentisphaerales bacterium]|nr:C25 family cysteine peptidase [Sedimentisphaerales bacterium]
GNQPVDASKVLEAGRLKDVRIYNRGLSASEIASIATPPYTSNPSPAHKSTVESGDVQLSWKAGKGAASHNVYFGDDYFAVYKATVDSDVFKGNVAGNTFSPSQLERRKTYYWRVDAVKGSKVTKGNVWRFYVPCQGGDLEGDTNGDCVVDLKDYASVAKDWSVGEGSVATAGLSCSTLGNSEGIKMSLSSVVVELSTDSDGYAKFYSYDGQTLADAGQPELQWKVISALLPPDADLSSVSARFDEVVYKNVGGSWKVRPAGAPALWDPNEMKDVFFWPEGKNIVDGYDVDIYKSNAFWPAQEVKLLGTGSMRKWKIVKLAVPLLRYNPVSGELSRLAMADISIDFNKISLQSLNSNVYSKTDVTGYDRVRNMTVNFDQFADNYDVVAMSKASANSGNAEGLAYVIITTNEIVQRSAMLNNFAAHKQALGYDVRIITETDFDDGGSATRRTLDIRNWLINFQNTDPGILEYVLFIGDPYPDGGGIPMYGSSDPTDLYYAELGTYSRPFIADVLVGRIPYYGIISDVDKILAKTIDYENQFSNSLEWRKNSLIMMKPLNVYSNPSGGTIGGTSWWLGEQVKNEILVPNGRNYHRIYDVNVSTDYNHIMPTPETFPCSDYTVADTWAEGKFGLAMYTTHGAPTGAAGIINLALMPEYHDTYPSFLVQCSCSTADPTNRRNLGFEFLKNQSVTSVGSTTPSYYDPSRTNFNNNDGYCLSQNYQYVKRVVTEGMTAGEALYGLIAAQTSTTNIYKFNLYGDPSLSLLAPGPADIDGNGIYDFRDLQLLSEEWLEDRNQ